MLNHDFFIFLSNSDTNTMEVEKSKKWWVYGERVNQLYPHRPEDIIFKTPITSKQILFTSKVFGTSEKKEIEQNIQVHLTNELKEIMEFNFFEFAGETYRIGSKDEWINEVAFPIQEMMSNPTGRLYLETVMLDYVKYYTNMRHEKSKY